MFPLENQIANFLQSWLGDSVHYTTSAKSKNDLVDLLYLTEK